MKDRKKGEKETQEINRCTNIHTHPHMYLRACRSPHIWIERRQDRSNSYTHTASLRIHVCTYEFLLHVDREVNTRCHARGNVPLLSLCLASCTDTYTQIAFALL